MSGLLHCSAMDVCQAGERAEPRYLKALISHRVFLLLVCLFVGGNHQIVIKAAAAWYALL